MSDQSPEISEVMPSPPFFSEEDMARFRDKKNYVPVLFEWYKFVGSLAVVLAHIKRNSPAFRNVPARHYHVLVGLLNRCSRLMLANVALSHEGRFGETTAIVDRCIFESGAKLIWLCEDSAEEKFVRYLADGLKTELEFKAQILENIKGRNNVPLPIETRMLESISNSITAAGLTDEEVSKSRKLPDMASILTAIGFKRLIYTVAQRIGSHHVHGTWPSLLFHYLDEEKNYEFIPRGHDTQTHINQFMFVPRVVLTAMQSYANYVLQPQEAQTFSQLYKSTEEKIMEIYVEAVGGDLGI